MVIVLKPLEAALRDHDHVYATVGLVLLLPSVRVCNSGYSNQILGTGVNSSGSLVPANAPAALAQRDAMVRAFAQARRSPSEVDFLELHATGRRSCASLSNGRLIVYSWPGHA